MICRGESHPNFVLCARAFVLWSDAKRIFSEIPSKYGLQCDRDVIRAQSPVIVYVSTEHVRANATSHGHVDGS